MEILIYAIIAGVLIYRLYSVFGQRDGGAPRMRKPFFLGGDDAGQGKSPQPARKVPEGKEKEDLLALPLALPGSAAKPRENGTAANAQGANDPARQPENVFYAEPAADSLAGGLYAIQKLDPSFDERSFLKGARAAFEMIVRAYTAGDRPVLKSLLVPKLYAAFEGAISEREAKGERWETRNFTLKDMDVTGAKLEGNLATLTVQVISEQSKAIYDKNGALLHDPGREVESLRDVWVFRRDVKSGNPNWQLVETRGA